MPRTEPRSVDVVVVGSLAASALPSALAARGHRVHIARDANETVATLVKARIALVAIPLDVPGTETRDFIERARIARPGVAIALSARPHEASRIVSAWSHGVDAYFIDPPDDAQLDAMLVHAIETADARMSASGDGAGEAELDEARRALEEERERVAKLRARVKKLEGSIAGLSSELKHVVKTRTHPKAKVGVAVDDEDAKTSIYREDDVALPSGAAESPLHDVRDPRFQSAPHAAPRGDRVRIEERMRRDDAARARVYDDSDWSESSTAAQPMRALGDEPADRDPASRAPIAVDPFVDDEFDATDPVDVNARAKGSAMKIAEFRDELSDLLRPPARAPPQKPVESARPRAATTDPKRRAPSSSDKPSRPRR